jgi:hypothetical protein
MVQNVYECPVVRFSQWFRRGRETHAEQEGSARLSISGSLLCLAASLRRIDDNIGHAAALV